MKKRTSILAVIMALCMILTAFPLSVSAIFPEYYYPQGTVFISKLGVGEHPHLSGRAKNDLEEAGFSVMGKDVNDGASGSYIYLGYKTSTNINDAIHGVRFYHSRDNTRPDKVSQNVNGRNVDFYLVGGSLEQGCANSAVDLNKRCGGDSDFIYMYISRDPAAGPPITNVSVNTSQYDGGWNTAGRINAPTMTSDLNAGASGDYIYFHYKSQGVVGPIDTTELRDLYARSAHCVANPTRYLNLNPLIDARQEAGNIINAIDKNPPSYVDADRVNNATYDLRTSLNSLQTLLRFDASSNGGECRTKSIPVTIGDKYSVSVDVSNIKATKGSWNFLGWSKTANSTTGYKLDVNVGFNETVYAIFSTDFNAAFSYLQAQDSTPVATENRNIRIYNADITGFVTTPSVPASVVYNGNNLTFKGWRNDNKTELPEITANGGKIEVKSGINYNYASVYSSPVTVNFAGEGATDLPAAVSANRLFNVRNTVTEGAADITIPGTVPAKHGYVFKGWATTASADRVEYLAGATIRGLKNDITLYPVWDKEVYTITFKNSDGNVLQTSEVAYGDMPSYTGETPLKARDTQFTYTFAGWDNEIVPADGAAVYTATFTNTTNSYKVTFNNFDGTTLLTADVEYGTVPSYTGAVPAKEANEKFVYEFAGWNKEIVPVTGDVTYTAVYTQSLRTYTVKFVNYDGTEVLDEQTLYYNDQVVYNGEVPVRASSAQFDYVFDKWTPEITAVEKDVVYKAVYKSTVRKYTVRFLDEAGNVVLQEDVLDYGKSPVYRGETPLKEKDDKNIYIFDGWDRNIEQVTGNADYTVHFMTVLRRYTITFRSEDGTKVLQQNDVPYGSLPLYTNPEPRKDPVDGVFYIFDKWTPEIVPVTGVADYKATFKVNTNKYSVKFVNADGSPLQEDSLEAGAVPVYNGATPEKAAEGKYAYVFIGWNKVIKAVTEDVTYTAVYSRRKNSFNIKFLDSDGTVLQSKVYKYGEIPALEGGNPVKQSNTTYHYTFEGWDKEVTPVKSNITYIAVYTAEKHNYQIASATPPTCTDEGKIVYTCSCGFSYEQTERAEGHDYKYIVEDGKAYKECTKCGDRIEVPLEEAENNSESSLCPYCGRYHYKYISPDLGWIFCFISRIFTFLAEFIQRF